MKKTLRASLAFVMAAALLAGCSSSGGSSKKDRKDRDNDHKGKTGFLGQMADALKDGKEDEKENNKKPIWGGFEEQVETTAPIEEETIMPTEPEVQYVELEVWAPAEDLTDYGWIEQMEEEFQAQHPEYEIYWENRVCGEGDAQALVTADPAAAADVYLFANDQLGTLVNSGAITRLGGSYAEQVRADNSQAMVGTVTYTDGNIYGFPVANNTWFMYYNKAIFTEQDVKSLDTMLTKGKVAFPWSIGWYGGAFFLANGGQIFGEYGNDVAAGIQFGAANGGYEAALKMVQLAAHPNLVEDYSGLGVAGMKDGSVHACFSGSWDAYGLREALGDNLGAVQLPMVEINGQQKQMKSFLGSKAVAVNPHTAYPAIATEFAAFLASVESQKARYELRGVIPAAIELVYDSAIRWDTVAVAEMNTAAYTSVVQPSIPEMSSYWTPMGTFGGMIAYGEITVENYKEQVEQMMFALNDEGL